jgi:hypothetical protein
MMAGGALERADADGRDVPEDGSAATAATSRKIRITGLFERRTWATYMPMQPAAASADPVDLGG